MLYASSQATALMILACDYPNVPFISATERQVRMRFDANVVGEISQALTYDELSHLIRYCQAYHRHLPSQRGYHGKNTDPLERKLVGKIMISEKFVSSFNRSQEVRRMF